MQQIIITQYYTQLMYLDFSEGPIKILSHLSLNVFLLSFSKRFITDTGSICLCNNSSSCYGITM